MNNLIIETFAKKVIEFLLYGPGYKAPEYAYVPITKTSDIDICDNKFQR